MLRSAITQAIGNGLTRRDVLLDGAEQAVLFARNCVAGDDDVDVDAGTVRRPSGRTTTAAVGLQKMLILAGIMWARQIVVC